MKALPHHYHFAWWRHQMETFSALLALCAGNSPVPVNSPHKGQWRGALMFSLICAWIHDWVNNREAGDLRRHHGHYDVIVMVREIHRSQMVSPHQGPVMPSLIIYLLLTLASYWNRPVVCDLRRLRAYRTSPQSYYYRLLNSCSVGILIIYIVSSTLMPVGRFLGARLSISSDVVSHILTIAH